MTRTLVCLAGLASLASPCRASEPLRVHAHLIDTAAVRQAVVAAHPELAGAVLELPASVPSHEAAPALLAGPLQPWTGSKSAGAPSGRVLLHCEEKDACLPFYVLVRGSEPGSHPEATLPPSPARESSVVRTGGGLPARAVRPGQRASLLIDSGRLHLRIPVTCLESGEVGNTIRVSGSARGIVYQAAVVDGSTVRGTL